MKTKPITFKGIWTRPRRPFEPGDDVIIRVGTLTFPARVTTVEATKDEEGNDALQVMIELLAEKNNEHEA